MIQKVLLVDDSEATNHLNKYLLQKLNICEEIVIATNGKKALDYVQQNLESLPDLILLDINMPVMDGFEFLDAIKPFEKKLNETVIIVLLTTSMINKDREKAKQYSYVRDYVIKPLKKEDMEKLYNQLYG